ncbi:MAG: synthase gamma chain [Myxococcaceae bacterium]|jgi:F-type H+-transporting ATPase subunit gamma|nr:synthase gamma chain [Myxococcaceae bacterium]
MPSLKIIRKRITSVKSTQKITRAMKMVAGARLNRAQARIVALRPYAVKTQEILLDVAESMRNSESSESEVLHTLLATRPEKRVVYVVLSSDRGLCGAFNANVNKAAEREWKAKESANGGDEGVEVQFVTVGKKGRDYLSRRGAKIAQDFQKIYDGLNLEKSKLVTHWLVSRFEKGEIDAIYLVYNEFKSAITQKVTIEQLLPLRARTEAEGAAKADVAGGVPQAEFLFEPNPTALLERLVPMYVEISLYRALLESQASEFGARMTAMDAATRNAKDMIARLTLVYNRARQAAITKELMEIIGGAEALKE